MRSVSYLWLSRQQTRLSLTADIRILMASRNTLIQYINRRYLQIFEDIFQSLNVSLIHLKISLKWIEDDCWRYPKITEYIFQNNVSYIWQDIFFDTYKFGHYTNHKQSSWSNIGMTLTVCRFPCPSNCMHVHVLSGQ